MVCVTVCAHEKRLSSEVETKVPRGFSKSGMVKTERVLPKKQENGMFSFGFQNTHKNRSRPQPKDKSQPVALKLVERHVELVCIIIMIIDSRYYHDW